MNAKAGTLGGKGSISGAVTIGTGVGSGAFLAPSVASDQPLRLTPKKTLTFKSDGTYTYKLNTNSARADQVMTKGVTIDSGAQCSSGTFSNLADGSTFTSGRNNYQVSYEGGDGNDLTLTAAP